MGAVAGIPWGKVYRYYVSGEQISYQECADKFHISVAAVKLRGSAEGWVKKKQEIFKAALALMDQRSVEIIAQRKEEHVKLARELLVGAAKQLREKKILPTTARDVKDWVDIGVKIERQALGMDVKQGQAVSVTDQKGQSIRVTWGDGSSLDSY